MNTILRLRLLIIVISVSLTAAACGGSQTAPTSTPVGSSRPASGDPLAMIADFYEALYGGGDAASFVCAASPEVAAVFRQSAALAGIAAVAAEVDLSRMTYSASDQTADSLTVTISGDVVYRRGENEEIVEYPETSIYVVNENGTWKVCGAG